MCTAVLAAQLAMVGSTFSDKPFVMTGVNSDRIISHLLRTSSHTRLNRHLTPIWTARCTTTKLKEVGITIWHNLISCRSDSSNRSHVLPSSYPLSLHTLICRGGKIAFCIGYRTLSVDCDSEALHCHWDHHAECTQGWSCPAQIHPLCK